MANFLEIINPATEELICKMPDFTAEDVDRAVKAARAAFDSSKWAGTPASERAKILWKIADRLTQPKTLEELAQLETRNVGKPIQDTRTRDIPRAADVLRYYAGWANKVLGETLPTASTHFAFTWREPIGVVGAIVPWNFPLVIAMYKIAPALACGNVVVLKPSEYSPLTALRLAEIAREEGLPAGVLNVITGGKETGKHLVAHPLVDKIAFTGSPEAGQDIMASCAKTLKRLHLELGGKSPHIVFADADLDEASAQVFRGIFFNAGQVCIAGSRLFVEKKAHDALMEKLLERTKQAKVGDPMDKKTTIGPLISKTQFDKVMNYLTIGKNEGANLICGGEKISRNGYFIQPTIFDDVSSEMKIAQEEIFGPVLSVIPFGDVNECIGKANSTRYGLAAGIWTRDIRRAYKVARAIKAGIVWVNCYYVMDPASPFGGFKRSGFGRDLGKQALENYTETKTVWVNLE